MSHMSEGITPLQIRLTLTIDVDPVMHGFDASEWEIEEVVARAINTTPGLQIADLLTRDAAGGAMHLEQLLDGWVADIGSGTLPSLSHVVLKGQS